jgi:hypothetical protein
MMTPFIFPFSFPEVDDSQVQGTFELEKPLPFDCKSQGSGFYRPAKIVLDDCRALEIILYHTPSISNFIYMRETCVDRNLLNLVGISPDEVTGLKAIDLPGQLCMGSDRSKLIGQAIKDIFASPILRPTITELSQQNLAIFPIAREGLKYQVAEAIFENYGFYCDEVILDAHHVFDSTVPVYNRKVEMTLFKDKDLDKEQREKIAVAFIADSIASGLVMKEVIERVRERFEKIRHVEVIAPLATVRGLCRVARSICDQNVKVRVHVFETLLNALPPDYYYSAHYPIPEFHIEPALEQTYRAWWGVDTQGLAVADTACAGYGWSEVFFSPRKQIQMMNSQLQTRHNLTIADIVRRNIHCG